MNKKIKQSQVKTVVRAIKDGRFKKAKRAIEKKPEMINSKHPRSGKTVREYIHQYKVRCIESLFPSIDKEALESPQGKSKNPTCDSKIL